jgi:hypothetical protein
LLINVRKVGELVISRNCYYWYGAKDDIGAAKCVMKFLVTDRAFSFEIRAQFSSVSKENTLFHFLGGQKPVLDKLVKRKFTMSRSVLCKELSEEMG